MSHGSLAALVAVAAAAAATALHEKPLRADDTASWRMQPEPNTYSEAVAEKTVAEWISEAAEVYGGSGSVPERWLSAHSRQPASTRPAGLGGSTATPAASGASQLVASGASKAAAGGAAHQAAQASAYVWHPDKYWPSIFVAVFSRRSAAPRRALVREMWQRADYKQGKLLVRFALCAAAEDVLASSLEEENTRYGDLMIMPCREGYSEGLLTKKTLSAMQEYHSNYWQQQLFMKIDDDTFAAWSRLWPLIAESWEKHSSNIYMGTQKPPGRPTRDHRAAFYEPMEVYPMEEYPQSADGGPGYILGGRLVARILDEHIGARWQLYNEDKAVGVWVDALVREGVTVNYVNVYGQTGYAASERDWHNQLQWFHQGRWVAYPLILHHRLSGEAIACLSRVEALKDPNATIDHCFGEADNTWVPINFVKSFEAFGGKLWTNGLKRLALKKRQMASVRKLAALASESDT